MNLEEVKKLKVLLRDSEAYRNAYYTRQQWAVYEDLWEGEYNLAALEDGRPNPTLAVPILVADNQRQMASLLGSDPRLQVFSNDPTEFAGARVLGSQLTHMMGSLRLMDEVRDAAQDTGTLGSGFLMTGFGSEFGTHRDTVLDGHDSSRVDSDGRRIEYHDNIADNMPWTLRAHPTEILFPPGTVRLSSAYGYFHIYQRPREAVHADDKLIRKHRGEIEPDSAYDTLTQTSNRATKALMFATQTGKKGSGDVDLCTLVDWLDYRTNRRVSFSPYYRFALRDEVDEVLLRLNRLNLEAIIFTQPSRAIWGTSDFKLQMSLAEEYNDIRTMQARIRHSQVPKAFIDKTWFEVEGEDKIDAAIEKMSSDQVAAFIVGEGNPNEVIKFATPGQPYDLFPQLDIIEKNIREFGSGQGPLQKGQMSAGRHTKYETQSAETHYDQGMFPRRKVVRDVIINILQNWSKLIFAFQMEPQLVRTYDALGNPVTVEFKGADLRGDYRFQLSLDSMRSRSHNEIVDEANMILSQLQPFTQPDASGKPAVNAGNLIKQYMSRLDSDWDIESLMEGPEPQQQPPQQFEQFQKEFMQQREAQPKFSQAMTNLGGMG